MLASRPVGSDHQGGAAEPDGKPHPQFDGIRRKVLHVGAAPIVKSLVSISEYQQIIINRGYLVYPKKLKPIEFSLPQASKDHKLPQFYRFD